MAACAPPSDDGGVRRLERKAKRGANLSRLYRVQVMVLDSPGRLARQPRRIELGEVIVRRAEQVEDVETRSGGADPPRATEID
jgi:hypothetical protein